MVVGNNPAKKYVFNLHEHVDFLRYAISEPRIRVKSIQNCLLADYAFEADIPTIVKGVRGIEDYDYERMMHEINITQQRGINTHILLAICRTFGIRELQRKVLGEKQHFRRLVSRLPERPIFYTPHSARHLKLK